MMLTYTITICFVYWLVPCLAVIEPLKFPDPEQKHFEFYFKIENRLTMIEYNAGIALAQDRPFIVEYNVTGEHYFSRSTMNTEPCRQTRFMNSSQIEAAINSGRFIFADGTHRYLLTINGTSPGPTLVVNQGSDIVLTVKNELFMEDVTIHFHGFHQRGRWWMDGVARVQQCPIPSGSTFVYRVKAEQAGTYWYHGHFGSDRSEGLMGAIIVVPANESAIRPKQSQFVQLENGNIVQVHKQYAVTVQEFNRQTPTDSYFHVRTLTLKLYDNLNDPSQDCYLKTRAYDGTGIAPVPLQSVVINGKGWYNFQDIISNPWKLPLDTISFEANQAHLLRLINVGMEHPLKISIEGHQLHVVASDGEPIQDVVVDALVLTPGERYDVLVFADQPPGTYYLTAETLELWNYFKNDTIHERHFMLARIQYNGTRIENKPVDNLYGGCTSTHQCKLLNCPWKEMPPAFKNIKCVHLIELNSFNPPHYPELLHDSYPSPTPFEEHFLAVDDPIRINGWKFVNPGAPPYQYSHNELMVMKPCNRELCYKGQDCTCTFHLNVTVGNVVQLVISNPKRTVLDGNLHPMHIHGHSFAVVKQGWGEYDPVHGIITNDTSDLVCKDGISTCFDRTWSNSTWTLGRIPGLKLDRPVWKDTFSVPLGSYIVLRFKADNPGWWFAHCHLLLHNTNGMAFAIREGTNEQMPQPPDGMPRCGFFDPQKPL